MIDLEKAKERAAQLKDEVGQAVGKATESMGTQAHDLVGEAKKGAGGAQEQLTDIGGKAKETLAGLSPIYVLAGVAGVVIVLAIARALSRAVRAARAREARGEA